MTEKKNFYLAILTELKQDTNLTRIRKKLSMSKENLNYYLRKMREQGYVIQKGRGWYEPSQKSENMTNHTFFLRPDYIRGHAYVWVINFPQEIKGWERRKSILEKKGIHMKMVGALRDIPRIKIMGRKVWLCKNHIRVYDTPNSSYYGQDARESRYSALQTMKLILNSINRKLGTDLKPIDIEFKKEHYSLIQNALAIEENKKGNIWRISDEEGEWLLIDDSLGKGGELENPGKKSFQTNIPLQKWWNEQKEQNFKVTPSFILNTFNKIAETQVLDKENILLHQSVLRDMKGTLKGIEKAITKLTKEVEEIGRKEKIVKYI